MNELVDLTFEEMQDFLTDPATRIIDSRMLEWYDSFAYSLQVLCHDNKIRQVHVQAEFEESEEGTKFVNMEQWRKDTLDLFKLQYRNSPRQNPALYGLLDAADAESRVEQTLTVPTR